MSLGALNLAELERRAEHAWQRRASLRERTEAWRLFDEGQGEWPEVRVEIFKEYAVLSPFCELPASEVQRAANVLLGLGVSGVQLKCHARGDSRRQDPNLLAPAEPLVGIAPPETLPLKENELNLNVHLCDGLSTGLFIDQRDNRERLTQSTQGIRFLNLFAYTCAFTVAAVVGGCSSSVSVDVSSKALRRGQENLALNPNQGDHRFIKEDARRWLARARRRGQTFDVAVLDPPSFSSSGKAFSVGRDYGPTARDVLALLAPGGRLLAVTNHRKTTERAFSQLLSDAAAAAGRQVRAMEVRAAPEDCPAHFDGSIPTKSVLVTLV